MLQVKGCSGLGRSLWGEPSPGECGAATPSGEMGAGEMRASRDWGGGGCSEIYPEI